MLHEAVSLISTLAQWPTQPSGRAALLVAVGAIPGALSRYYLTWAATRRFGPGFPYGTLIINLTGSVLIGVLATLAQRLAAPIAADLQALLLVGFLGAYTTFSTYVLDASHLRQAGQTRLAWLYGWGSPVLGLLGVELGIGLAKGLG